MHWLSDKLTVTREYLATLSLREIVASFLLPLVKKEYSLLVKQIERKGWKRMGMNRVLRSMYVINLCHSYRKGRPLSRYRCRNDVCENSKIRLERRKSEIKKKKNNKKERKRNDMVENSQGAKETPWKIIECLLN